MRVYSFLLDRERDKSKVHLCCANDVSAFKMAWEFARYWPVKVYDDERLVTVLTRSWSNQTRDGLKDNSIGPSAEPSVQPDWAGT